MPGLRGLDRGARAGREKGCDPFCWVAALWKLSAGDYRSSLNFA